MQIKASLGCECDAELLVKRTGCRLARKGETQVPSRPIG